MSSQQKTMDPGMDPAYREMVNKSVLKQYTETDRRKLGMEPVAKRVVGTWPGFTLLACGECRPATTPPVVVVPSLINRPYIMDLLPGHSLLESMTQAGLAVYLIDWGIPDDSIGHFGFDHYIGVCIRRAVRRVKRLTGATRVSLAGQCIGGLMAAAYAAHPTLAQDLDRLFLLTAPIDLQDSGLLANWTKEDAFDVEKITVGFTGTVPAEFLHTGFPFLDVKKSLGKYKTLLENFKIPGFPAIWQALDIWANDNVPFAKQAFCDLIRVFYQENRLHRGTYPLLGQSVSARDIHVPTLALVAAEDHVFTEKAASAIRQSQAAAHGRLQYHVMPAGHVTLVAAHPVRTETYRLVNEFLLRPGSGE